MEKKKNKTYRAQKTKALHPSLLTTLCSTFVSVQAVRVEKTGIASSTRCPATTSREYQMRKPLAWSQDSLALYVFIFVFCSLSYSRFVSWLSIELFAVSHLKSLPLSFFFPSFLSLSHLSLLSLSLISSSFLSLISPPSLSHFSLFHTFSYLFFFFSTFSFLPSFSPLVLLPLSYHSPTTLPFQSLNVEADCLRAGAGGSALPQLRCQCVVGARRLHAGNGRGGRERRERERMKK